MGNRTILESSFLAEDETGKQYEVNIFRTVHDTSSLDGAGQLKGMAEYRINGLGAINKISDDEYLIVSTDTKIKKL